MNANFDGLLATTISQYRAKLEDIVFSSKVLLWILTRNGGPVTGHGNKLVVPLLYAESDNIGSYSDDDVFAAPVLADPTAAEFDWSQYRGTFRMTGLEEAKNSGPQAILSLLKARMTQLEMSIAEDVNRQFFGDGTGNGGKDFEGLAAIVSATNTYGGINRATAANINWRSYVDSAATALSEARMRTAYNTPSEGNDQPTNILTTQAGYEAFEALLIGSRRYTDDKMADAGFQNLMFKGAPVAFDRSTAAGEMYFLNTKYLEIYKLNNRWFEISDWLVPTNQDVKFKNIYLAGQLVTTNAKRQGVLRGVTDA